MANYYTKVVEDLLNYKKNVQRLKKIKLDCEDKALANLGFDYSSSSGNTNNISDRTGEIATEIVDEMSEEYKELYNQVRSVEIAFQGLNDREQFIIKRKYMSGRKVPDVEIYSHPQFEPNKTKYYEIKDRAVKKIAEIMGYI